MPCPAEAGPREFKVNPFIFEWVFFVAAESGTPADPIRRGVCPFDTEHLEGNMDIKKLLFISTAVVLLGANVCLAGQTTITGSARCVMPDLFEFKTQEIVPEAATAPAKPAMPVPSGASGKYEVTKEEKLIQTEDMVTVTDEGSETAKATVYTICAK